MVSVIIKDFTTSSWLELTSPKKVWSVFSDKEVTPCLVEIDAEIANGSVVAGFIGYEASPAFDDSYVVRDKIDFNFPLLWFASFNLNDAKIIDLANYRSTSRNFSAQLLPTISLSKYRDDFIKIKDSIFQGESYQVNYSFRAYGRVNSNLKDVFFDLIKKNNLPYASYIDTKHFTICSLSPELFFRLDNKKIESHPMKGTISRGLSSISDKENFQKLKFSAKENAENIMITDMVRNDLGKIAEIASVKTSCLCEIKKYQGAWQMISKVTAKINNPSLSSILKALFPGASITGAPKSKATQIISSLEDSPRKIYTGAIGYWLPGKKAQFNLAIRSLLVDKKTGLAEYGTGSGIVWDSKCEKEFDECLLKANWFNQSSLTKKFSLLETIFWSKNNYPFLQGHLSRLTDSANYWDIKVERAHIIKRLTKITTNFKPQTPYKVRLLLSLQGRITIKYDSLPLHFQAFPNIKIAPQPIDANNNFLYHKTTNRSIYQKLLKKTGTTDLLLYNKKNMLTETTIANIAVKIDNTLFTPPLECGLLPGVMRGYLLGKGVLREKNIPVSILSKNPQIFLMNAIRGLQKVDVIPH